MYRTHTCGELRASHIGQTTMLSGWVQRRRELGGMTFVDLRDRYGITQLVFNDSIDAALLEQARRINREYVIRIEGDVVERESRNPRNPTGDVEVVVRQLTVLSSSKTPPFTIEDETDGGEELRMRYRYLDLRRSPVRDNLLLRHRVGMVIRRYLSDQGFIDVETPYLIKSTPEGARDFVVPSRMNPREFYALPQSPQTFKQLLMVAGMDKYFQIVRCFRDEDLRADRQPEFTQIDCEMTFVEQEDILNTFEGLVLHLLREIKGVEIAEVPRMTWHEAMKKYGSDKPDIRFGMELTELNNTLQGTGFKVFDDAGLIVGITVKGAASWSRKQLDALTEWVRRPQIGMGGVIWAKYGSDGSRTSSVNKFIDENLQEKLAGVMGAEPGDLMLVLAGEEPLTRKAMSSLRLHLGEELGLRKPDEFAPLWVTDFPLLEWDEETRRYYAMHHPFTAPKPEDIALLESDPGKVRANAYDIVLNGNEIGGGSIRIHDSDLQKRMFTLLGFSDEEAQAQFGFLMNAFEYGAPPHGGIAFGFDRLVAILGGDEVIRDYIAFPKNNTGRDVMIDAPSLIDKRQLDELYLKHKPED